MSFWSPALLIPIFYFLLLLKFLYSHKPFKLFEYDTDYAPPRTTAGPEMKLSGITFKDEAMSACARHFFPPKTLS